MRVNNESRRCVLTVGLNCGFIRRRQDTAGRKTEQEFHLDKENEI